jgi:hypothetical protein
MPYNGRLPSRSRRSFLHMSAAVSVAVAFRIMTEPMLAGAYDRAFPEDAVMINEPSLDRAIRCTSRCWPSLHRRIAT